MISTFQQQFRYFPHLKTNKNNTFYFLKPKYLKEREMTSEIEKKNYQVYFANQYLNYKYNHSPKLNHLFSIEKKININLNTVKSI